MSKLTAWSTPFETASFPSVWISAVGDLRKTIVFVRAEQLWQIQFENIVGLKICDESYDDNTRFHIERGEQGRCSYLWDDSPWLDGFNTEHVEAIEEGKLKHYVLLGGDYNIEVLALGDVEITPAAI